MTPQEFEQRYEAATTNEERVEVLTEGLRAYSQQVGVATAEYMNAIEDRDWQRAALIGYDISGSVGLMNSVLAIVSLSDSFREGGNNE